MNLDCKDKPYCTFALTVIAASWVLLALFAGETAALQWLPAPGLPVVVWSLTGILLLSYWKNRAFRSFIDDLTVRTLLAVHLARFVGIYFIYLASRDRLPSSFANFAGWGDIIAALGATALMAWPVRSWLAVWNLAGLADMLLVIFCAAREFLIHRHAMDEFTILPLSFLPTLVVPLILFSHFLLFLRLRRRGEAGAHPVSLPI